MLSSTKSIVASSLLAFGHFSQGVNAQCVGESNNVQYEFCGSFPVRDGQVGPTVNVYWTTLEEPQVQTPQTNILFERADVGYTAFGFGTALADTNLAMIGAHHVFGCHDFEGVDSPLDSVIFNRSLEGVAGGLGLGTLVNEGSITENRANGICGIRFERRNELLNPVEIAADPDRDLSLLNIVANTPNTIVWAAGPGDAPAIHTAFNAAEQDFLANTGALTNNPVEIISQECVGQTNGVAYRECGRFGPMNVYWTPNSDTTTILFERADEGYTAFGFASNDVTPMIGANHILGCHDWVDYESPSDGLISGRAPEAVLGGLGQNGLAIEGTINEIRANGVCGIEFERLHILGPNALNVTNGGPVENQNLIAGTENVIIWAVGDGAEPSVHTARGAMSQDFLALTGDISDSPIEPFEILDPDQGAAENSASSLSVKLSAIVVSMAAAFRFF